MKAIFYAVYLVQLIISCPGRGDGLGSWEIRLNSARSCGFIKMNSFDFFSDLFGLPIGFEVSPTGSFFGISPKMLRKLVL